MTPSDLLCLALVALLAYREWGAARERGAAAAELSRSRAEELAERQVWARERKELCQRIQAPEIAVHDAQLEARRERPYVRRKPIGADEDAAYVQRGNGRDESSV